MPCFGAFSHTSGVLLFVSSSIPDPIPMANRQGGEETGMGVFRPTGAKSEKQGKERALLRSLPTALSFGLVFFLGGGGNMVHAVLCRIGMAHGQLFSQVGCFSALVSVLSLSLLGLALALRWAAIRGWKGKAPPVQPGYGLHIYPVRQTTHAHCATTTRRTLPSSPWALHW